MIKEAKQNIKDHLTGECAKVNNQIFSNTRAMKNLVDNQTMLKRKRVILQQMINSLTPTIKRNKDKCTD
jgi:hypothetical protein